MIEKYLLMKRYNYKDKPTNYAEWVKPRSYMKVGFCTLR